MSTLTKRTVKNKKRSKPKKFLVSPLGDLSIFDEEKPLLEPPLVCDGVVDRPPGYKLVEKIPSVLFMNDAEMPSVSLPEHSSLSLVSPVIRKNHKKKNPWNIINGKIPRKTHTRKMTEETFDSTLDDSDSTSIEDHNHEVFEAAPRLRVTFSFPLDDGGHSPAVSMPIPLSPRPISWPLTRKEEATSHIPHLISFEQDDSIDSDSSDGRRRNRREFFRRSSSESSDSSFGGTTPHLLSFEDDEMGHCHENCGFIRKCNTGEAIPVSDHILRGVSFAEAIQNRRKLKKGTSETSLEGLKFLEEEDLFED